MKKHLKLIATILAIIAIVMVFWICFKVTKKDDVEYVKSCYNETITASTINQSVIVKNGDTLISSKVIVYSIMADKSVTATQTVTMLNSDPKASDLYIIKNENISINADDSATVLPTSINLNRDDWVNREYTYTESKEYDTFSFDLQQNCVTSFFGLTAEEASEIMNVKVTIIIKDKKVTEYKATYDTLNGNSVEIKINYFYVA